MRRDEIQAVLNGLYFQEDIETPEGLFRIVVSATYTADASRRNVFALLGGPVDEPAQGGILDVAPEVLAHADGNWHCINPTRAPSSVLRRYADIKDEFNAWRNGGPWPKPRT